MGGLRESRDDRRDFRRNNAIALAALKVARRSAPDVYGEFEVFEKADDAPADVAPVFICITARNRGLSTVDIESFEMINGDGQGNYRWRFNLDDTCELDKGPSLPTPIRNGKKVAWWYDVRHLKFDHDPTRHLRSHGKSTSTSCCLIYGSTWRTAHM